MLAGRRGDDYATGRRLEEGSGWQRERQEWREIIIRRRQGKVAGAADRGSEEGCGGRNDKNDRKLGGDEGQWRIQRR